MFVTRYELLKEEARIERVRRANLRHADYVVLLALERLLEDNSVQAVHRKMAQSLADKLQEKLK